MKTQPQTALGLLNDVNQVLTDAGWDNLRLYNNVEYADDAIRAQFLHDIRALLNRWSATSHVYCVRHDCDDSPLTTASALRPVKTPYDRQAAAANSFIGHS